VRTVSRGGAEAAEKTRSGKLHIDRQAQIYVGSAFISNSAISAPLREIYHDLMSGE